MPEPERVSKDPPLAGPPRDAAAPATPDAAPAEAAAANQLSPEEQLARFEQELKEKDWGHQPC